jgi:FAD/FMN-containing dehydrogenase
MSGASESDWQRLERMVAGRVLRPGQPGFRSASVPFNKRFARTTPGGVVSVTSVADVSRAIEWAHEVGVDVVARSGGHSYGGYSVCTGLVIDLSALNTVSANGSTGLVTAAGGARTGEVYAAIQPHEMAFPLGNGASVGVGGLTLGGGSAAVSRKFGLTADTLVRTEIVTADGRLRSCDAQENTDLYWACRGGGGGNFGINVSFTFQARPVADVSTCLLLWDRDDAPKVLSVLQEIARQAPEEFSVRLGVATGGSGPTSGSGAVVSAVGLHLGPASELREILEPVLAVARPVREDVADRTNFATEPLPDEAIATMLSWIERWPGSDNPDGGGFAMFAWGGAINRVAPTATAFAHRDAQYLVAVDTSWAEHDGPAVVGANLRWLAGLREALAPYVSGAAYQNFIDPDLADWRTAYYGVNYPRLVEIKQQVDPNGFFAFEQGIGPSRKSPRPT